jgi:Zn-dependent peptidase ImmA (M78 family)
LNHPTACFKKSAIIEVGNYNDMIRSMMEDFDLWLRILKKYEKIYNVPEVLLNYRLHDKQVTHKGGTEGAEYWNEKRNEIISKLLH